MSGDSRDGPLPQAAAPIMLRPIATRPAAGLLRVHRRHGAAHRAYGDFWTLV
jgi:hypothetical protein